MAIRIENYSENYFDDVAVLMEKLQEHERKLSSNRAPGSQMAQAHLRYLLEECKKTAGVALVAVEDKPVGFLILHIERCDSGDVHLLSQFRRYGLITDLYVEPEFRGQGIGKALTDRAEEHCRKNNVTSIQLHTLSNNLSAGSFYKSLEYQPYETIFRKEL